MIYQNTWRIWRHIRLLHYRFLRQIGDDAIADSRLQSRRPPKNIGLHLLGQLAGRSPKAGPAAHVHTRKSPLPGHGAAEEMASGADELHAGAFELDLVPV